MTYFYIDATGKTCGPISESEFATHGITSDTPLWREGMEDWARAHNVPELAMRFSQLEEAPETTPAIIPMADVAEPQTVAPTEVEASPENVAEVVEDAPLQPEHTTPPALPVVAPAVEKVAPALPESAAPAVVEPVRNSWEATQRVNTMESLDLWKWLNIALAFFAVLGMCFALTWIALPCAILGAMHAHDTLRYAPQRTAEQLDKALKRTKMYCFIGVLLFVAGIVGQILFTAFAGWVMK